MRARKLELLTIWWAVCPLLGSFLYPTSTTWQTSASAHPTRIPILGRREHLLASFYIDLNTQTLHSEQTFSNHIDENNPVLLDVDTQSSTFVYVESLSKISHDNVHLVHLDRPKDTRPTEIQRHGSLQSDELITSLAVDWVTKKVYLSVDSANNQQSGRIEACCIDWWLAGKRESKDQCLVVMHRDLDSLHALVVDPTDGYMYWLNRLHKRVERAWMNGRHLDKHPFNAQVSEQQVAAVGTLTMEHVQRRLFYTRRRFNSDQSEIIQCTLYSRASCKVVASGAQALHMVVVEQFLFWKAVDGLHYCLVEKCDRNVTRVADSETLDVFRVLSQSVQPNRTNPCAVHNGNCSHFCLLTPGVPWHSCACPTGIRLLGDQLTCDPHGLKKVLLIGSTSGLYFISLDTSDSIPQRVAGSTEDPAQLHKIVDVDYDPVDGYFYWIDKEPRKIRRCRLDGSEFADLPIPESEAREATQLVVDPLGRNLIWLDSTNGRLELLNLRPSTWFRTTLLSGLVYQSNGATQLPKTLAFDVKLAYIYFSTVQDDISKIERVRLDGHQLDSASKQLFWSNRDMGMLMSADLEDNDDGEFDVIAERLDNPNAIAKSGLTLFYSSFGGRSLNAVHLKSTSFRLNDNESKFEFTDSFIYGQLSMKAVVLRQPTTHSGCLRSNGGCEHICVPLPDKQGHRCLCSMEYELHADNRSCVRPLNFLIYSTTETSNDLRKLSIQNAMNFAQVDRKMHISGVSSSPLAIALNPSTSELVLCTESSSRYSSTPTARLIRSNLNGTDTQVLLEDRSLRTLKGLAIDWVTGNIYWSNGQLRRVEVQRRSGRKQKTIAWLGIDPRQIVVDSTAGVLFFVDCSAANDKCSIRKCLLAGCPTGGDVFVSDVDLVESLTFDVNTNLLFWSNGRQIWSMQAGGSNQLQYLDNLVCEITSITAYAGQLYFANATDSTIRRMHQTPNSVSQVLRRNAQNVTSMLIGHSNANHLLRKLANSLDECRRKSEKDRCVCMPNDGVYKCECFDQEEVNTEDGKCAVPSKFVLMASRDRFVRFKIHQHLQTFENLYDQDPYQVLSVNNVGHPVAIAFDLLSSSRHIYWIDAFDRDGADVKRASDSSSFTEYLNLAQNTQCSRFHDIVCDTIGRQLFVSCSKSRNEPNAFVHVWRIEPDDQLQYLGFVVDGNQKSPITQTYPSPRRLAVFNQLKTLFYVDENPSLDSPHIVRCTLEGRHCFTLVSHGLHFHQVRLSSDLATHRLVYSAEDGIWSRDIFMETDIKHPLLIEPYSSVLIQHSDRLTETQISYVQIDNLAVVDDKTILFTATNQSRYDDLLFQVANNATVTRIDQLYPLRWASDELLRRRIELLVVGTLSALGHASMNSLASGCLNSSCSHLCVASHNRMMPVTKQFECLCPIGYSRVVGDETRCRQNVQCKAWQFACQNGFECIHSALKCDKIVDCSDESDESPLRCNLLQAEKEHLMYLESSQWVCDDRRMPIQRDLLCNGQADCTDESDEAYCRCANPSTHFDCNAWDHIRRPTPDNSTSHCVLRSLLCDGRAQCQNVADELPQVCKHYASEDRKSWVDNEWLSSLFVISALFLLFFLSICFCACFAYRRSRQKGRYRPCRRSSDHLAELPFQRFWPATAQAFMVSSAYPGNEQHSENLANGVEIALHTFPSNTHLDEFPIYESASLPYKHNILSAYNSLPWAASNRLQLYSDWKTLTPASKNKQYNRQPMAHEQDNFVLYGAGEAMASSVSNEVTSSLVLPAPDQMHGQHFRAPPPSAASISTYGIAKPTRVRYSVSLFPPTNTQTSTTSSSSSSSNNRRSKRPKRRKRQKNLDERPTLSGQNELLPLPSCSKDN